MEKRHLIEQHIEERLQDYYQLYSGKVCEERLHFQDNGLIFRIDTIGGEFNGIVVEYAQNEKQAANNLFEDGDCFCVDDLSEDQIFDLVIAEIKDAKE